MKTVVLPAAMFRTDERGLDQRQPVREVRLDARPFHPQGQAARCKRVAGRADIVSRRPVEKCAGSDGGMSCIARPQRQPANIDVEVHHVGDSELLLLEAAYRIDAADFLQVQVAIRASVCCTVARDSSSNGAGASSHR